jgi:endonuclease/exonuclease/phosphatase family metal-dependent hydrolase
MPEFPKPRFEYAYDVATEIGALRAHRRARGVPKRAAGELLIGTWNVANFGAHERRDEDHRLIAEILSWFDVVAIQECRDNFAGLADTVHTMGPRYAYLMSDAAGNDERLVFVYDRRKVALLEEVGEVAFPPSDAKRVKLPGITAPFAGFDRTPYLASFQLDERLSVLLVNVHLFYGGETRADVQRRALETGAVARWADRRRRSRLSFARELVALGDFNLPKTVGGTNAVLDAVTAKGLVLPAHSTVVGSSIASDNHYDQVAIFPSTSKRCLVDLGVFDYDAVVFRDLYAARPAAAFLGYLRYYLSDHRPMWVRMRMQ